ncbi:MAG: histidine phosphatase family protein [Spirochaetes bacterium]|nr:histidine phosphatase family protein [Spirochaetota bacterium]
MTEPTLEIFLVRHGMRVDFENPDWSRTAAFPSDPPLSDLGRRQACELGRALADKGIRAVYASPFWRCLETAHAIAQQVGCPVRIERGLGEWLNQEWFPAPPEFVSGEERGAHFPLLSAVEASKVIPAWPETEGIARERQASAVKALIAGASGPMVLVGHGHSVQGMLAALTGCLPHEVPPCASITRLSRLGNRWQARKLFDTSHLSVQGNSSRFV